MSAPGDTPVGDAVRRLAGLAPPGKPEIVVIFGEYRTVCVDKALDALRVAKTPFYKQDRRLVRVFLHLMRDAARREVPVTGVADVTPVVLLHELVLAADWVRIDANGNKWPCDPPRATVDTILAKPDLWKFPTLIGLLSTPTLRPDGSLLATKGYDAATGLLLHDLPPMPPIPDRPTRADALTALQLWLDALAEFPFVSGAARSVALSGVLTVIGRGALPGAVLLHLLTAPVPGTGKSYYVDVVAVTATGQRCPVITGSKDTIELDKRLNGMALKGAALFSIDNLFVLPSTELLCQLTERPLIDLRPLGVSTMIRTDNTFSLFATGNNVQAEGDMVRRHLRCELDANVERPAERVFKRGGLLAEIMADRGRYIAAALTILRAYITAGMPNRPTRLGSYAEWSDLVRGALIWLGQDDPVETMRDAGDEDPDTIETAEGCWRHGRLRWAARAGSRSTSCWTHPPRTAAARRCISTCVRGCARRSKRWRQPISIRRRYPKTCSDAGCAITRIASSARGN
jgi:putative DNA primase/helicase